MTELKPCRKVEATVHTLSVLGVSRAKTHPLPALMGEAVQVASMDMFLHR